MHLICPAQICGTIAKTALPKKTRSVDFQLSDFIYNFQKGLTITARNCRSGGLNARHCLPATKVINCSNF